MSNAAVEALGVGKVYWDGNRKLVVLEGVNFALERGEMAAILGPSGSGKTTLLNILSGLDEPTAGRVFFAGSDWSRLADRQKAALRNRAVGFVFQFYHLLSEFTALENVMLPALMAGHLAGGGRGTRTQAKEKAVKLLERVGLSERAGHFPSELSGGEQQRAAIARALINDPEVLFCDEPTGNLDREAGGQIARLLKELAQEGRRTVVVVTHDPQIAGQASKIWDMVSGRWMVS